MNGVYDGLTVVELADRRNQWAGKLLSDSGARVIQIEPTAGRPGRWCGLRRRHGRSRPLSDYWWYNTGKQAWSRCRSPAGSGSAAPPAGRRRCLLEHAAGDVACVWSRPRLVSSNRALIYTR
jgi:hypothetical protein